MSTAQGIISSNAPTPASAITSMHAGQANGSDKHDSHRLTQVTEPACQKRSNYTHFATFGVWFVVRASFCRFQPTPSCAVFYLRPQSCGMQKVWISKATVSHLACKKSGPSLGWLTTCTVCRPSGAERIAKHGNYLISSLCLASFTYSR